MKHLYLLILQLLFFGGVSAQSSLKWNYPCKPGTDCWNALTSVEERQSACQIKGLDLSTLSTEELLLITMEHPFFRSYAFHDSPVDGLGFALDRFNGYQEFISRNNAMQTLAEVYAREEFGNVSQLKDSIQIGEYTLRWTGVELMMTNQNLLSSMTDEESIHYLRQLHSKLMNKRRLQGVFGGTSFGATALIYHRLSQTIGIKPSLNVLNFDGFDLFQSKLIVTNNRIVESLLEDFDRFINK